jgi:hypothetical protein
MGFLNQYSSRFVSNLKLHYDEEGMKYLESDSFKRVSVRDGQSTKDRR